MCVTITTTEMGVLKWRNIWAYKIAMLCSNFDHIGLWGVSNPNRNEIGGVLCLQRFDCPRNQARYITRPKKVWQAKYIAWYAAPLRVLNSKREWRLVVYYVHLAYLLMHCIRLVEVAGLVLVY